MPQRHEPPPEQVSARPEGQTVQVLPPAPQAPTVGGVRQGPVALLQQPLAQLPAVQLQTPDAQLSPAPHAAPLPHLHTPAEHAFELPVHAAHAAPPVPHWLALCEAATMQVPLLQHPDGQLVASQPEQAWLTQLWAPHDAHAAPPVPQAELLVPC